MHLFVMIYTLVASAWATPPEFLPFDVVKNGVEVLPTRLQYGMRRDGDIIIGKIRVSKNTFKLDPGIEDSSLRWPDGIFENPKVEITQGSKLVFQSTPRADQSSGAVLRAALDVDQEQLSSWSKNAPLRVCLSDDEAAVSAKICMPHFRVMRGQLQNTRQRVRPVVLINQKKAGLRGSIAISPGGDPVQLAMRGPTGYTVEAVLKIEKRIYLDLQKNKDGSFLLSYRLSSEPVTADPRRLTLANEESVITVKEKGQFPLQQEILITNIVPTEADRVYLHGTNSFKTYSSIHRLHLQRPSKDIKLIPVDGSLRSLYSGAVEWQIQNIERDQKNRKYLAIEKQGRKLFTYAEVSRYRSIILSLYFGSLPVTGVQTKEQGEVDLDASELYTAFNFQWWFDDIFRMRVPWLTIQRIGYNLEIMTPISASEAGGFTQVTSSVFYRFSKGIVFLEPTIGLKSSFRFITEADVTSTLFGAGLFTHFEAPYFLSALTSWIFDVPHWIYIDFESYPSAFGSDTTISASTTATLKYQYLLSKSLNMDISVQYRSDDFTVGEDQSYSSNWTLTTLGLGYRF